ncbi:cob(I)yrinic acid a,c-diamide adenosyltransferase [Candidatus Peregrinibacteria bacterium]|nr:cob(I)yrinic acid a,c-diamide adenosyltransferase [Candidatus Peregrinibacteria bacterium]
MSIVTRTGDKGKTGLFGGQRVSKASPRLHAYGTVDELNACLGVILAEPNVPDTVKDQLLKTQRLLFLVGADLATPLESAAKIARVESTHVLEVESWINRLEQTLPVLQRFILPSGSRLGALLHQARTVCRRAERWVVELGEKEPTNLQVQIYLNRLSDYLFVVAREANRSAGAPEIEV